MSPESRERFLRHGRAFWDIHRHRVAPDLYGRVRELDTGQIVRAGGEITGAEDRAETVRQSCALAGGRECF